MVNANSDSQVAPLGEHFRSLGKVVFAVFDKQDPAQKADIESKVEYAFEAPERSFESVLLKGTQEAGLRRYALGLVGEGEWPTHLAAKTPTESMPLAELRDALSGYLGWSKGAGGAADLLGECTLEEMPEFIVQTLSAIQEVVRPTPTVEIVSDPIETELPPG